VGIAYPDLLYSGCGSRLVDYGKKGQNVAGKTRGGVREGEEGEGARGSSAL